MSVKQLKTFFLHKQTFLLILVISFFWFTIDALYGYQLTVKDLVSHKGSIVLIDTLTANVPNKKRKGSKDKYFSIVLNTELKRPFKLLSTRESKSYNYYVTSNIKLGDTVTILTEPKFLEKLIGRKESNVVIKLVKGNMTIIDHFKLSTKVSFNMLFIYLPLFITFSMLYFFKARRRYISLLRSYNVFE